MSHNQSLVDQPSIASSAQQDIAVSTPYEKASYRYYVLAILSIMYAFNFIDRQLLVILQEPIKAELLLSDTQLGLLTGFAFAVFYVVCGIPIARWADLGSRRSIIAISLATWSLMTAVSGFTQNFFQLLLARMGVGVGEAGGSPPAHSMISDIFSKKHRATALSTYSLGVNLGMLSGFVLGGWLAEQLGWRMAFVVVGLPGVLLAIVIRLTVAEPPRGWSQGQQASSGQIPGISQVLAFLWSRRTFRHLAMAAGLHALVAYGLGNWIPSYLLRNFDISIGEVGLWLGLNLGIAGGAGTFLGGYLGDRLSKRDVRWYTWLPAICIFLCIPSIIIVLTLENVYWALLVNIIPTFLLGVYLGPVLAMTHNLVGLRMRALSSAVLFFVLNLIGLGLGPTAVGVLSDLFTPSYGDGALRLAMIIMACIGAGWAFIHYMFAARTLKEDLEKAPD